MCPQLYSITDNCGGKEERFQCANKKCITSLRACNGKDDCGDGSDEAAELCASKPNICK